MLSDTELQVLIPYKRLLELLEASQRVDKLQSDVDHIRAMYDALQARFTELCIKFKELSNVS